MRLRKLAGRFKDLGIALFEEQHIGRRFLAREVAQKFTGAHIIKHRRDHDNVKILIQEALDRFGHRPAGRDDGHSEALQNFPSKVDRGAVIVDHGHTNFGQTIHLRSHPSRPIILVVMGTLIKLILSNCAHVECGRIAG